MESNYDVIVIGAGNGGLTAAATTAKQGYKTLVLEKHNIPGGCATSFRRGRFEFDVSLHGVASFGPAERPGPIRKIFDELGIDLNMKADEDWVRGVAPGPDGYDIVLPAEREGFISAVEAADPGCREAVERMFALGDSCMRALGYLAQGAPDPKVLASEHADFLRCASHSVDEVMASVGLSGKAQNIISICWAYLGTPTNELKALHFCLMLVGYCSNKAYVPPKRSYSISLALADVVQQNGGDIWLGTEVSRVLIKDGRAYGVETKSGQTVYAKQIISNVIPTNVLGLMADAKEVPESALKLANARRLALSSATIYFGLNKSIEELGMKDYAFKINTSPSSREQYEQCHDIGANHFTSICCPNVLMPDASPPGTTMLSITQTYFGKSWDEVTPENYYEMKNLIADRAIEDMKTYGGIDIRDCIEEIEVATPATFARFLGTPNGTMYGYYSGGWDNLMSRMLARGTEDEPVKGLRFAGGHSYKTSGYSSSYETGSAMGKKAVEALREGK